MTRKEIKDWLANQKVDRNSNEYEKLKDCLGCGNEIDGWFRSVVNSVNKYYPNVKLFALVGSGLNGFFDNILPSDLQRSYSTTLTLDDKAIYEKMIVNIPMRKSIISIIKHYHYRVTKDGADKRLCSVCTTTEKWDYPQSKNLVVVKVNGIDWELYNSIDKTKLWVEIFNRF